MAKMISTEAKFRIKHALRTMMLQGMSLEEAMKLATEAMDELKKENE